MAAKKKAHEQSEAPPVVVKKVKPYPIHAAILLVAGGPPLKAKIVRLTDFGFLLHCEAGHPFQVGNNHQAQFDLPLSHHYFDEAIKVVKTYDSMEIIAGAKVKYAVIEMHFRELSEESRGYILQFMKHIGQKK